MKSECKFLELCLSQRSAKVRSSAILAISGFLSPSQKVKNICQHIFLEMEEQVWCLLLHQKFYLNPKAKVLVWICLVTQALSFLTQSVFFFFPIQCVLVALIYLFHFSLFFLLYSSISNLIFFCSNFSLSISLVFSSFALPFIFFS